MKEVMRHSTFAYVLIFAVIALALVGCVAPAEPNVEPTATTEPGPPDPTATQAATEAPTATEPVATATDRPTATATATTEATATEQATATATATATTAPTATEAPTLAATTVAGPTAPSVEDIFASGEVVFATNCAFCHGASGQGSQGGAPALDGNPFVTSDDPTPVIHRVLVGSGPMPAFQDRLSDEQIAAVVSYIRSAWTNEAGVVTPQQVAAVRE